MRRRKQFYFVHRDAASREIRAVLLPGNPDKRGGPGDKAERREWSAVNSERGETWDIEMRSTA